MSLSQTESYHYSQPNSGKFASQSSQRSSLSQFSGVMANWNNDDDLTFAFNQKESIGNNSIQSISQESNPFGGSISSKGSLLAGSSSVDSQKYPCINDSQSSENGSLRIASLSIGVGCSPTRYTSQGSRLLNNSIIYEEITEGTKNADKFDVQEEGIEDVSQFTKESFRKSLPISQSNISHLQTQGNDSSHSRLSESCTSKKSGLSSKKTDVLPFQKNEDHESEKINQLTEIEEVEQVLQECKQNFTLELNIEPTRLNFSKVALPKVDMQAPMLKFDQLKTPFMDKTNTYLTKIEGLSKEGMQGGMEPPRCVPNIQGLALTSKVDLPKIAFEKKKFDIPKVESSIPIFQLSMPKLNFNKIDFTFKTAKEAQVEQSTKQPSQPIKKYHLNLKDSSFVMPDRLAPQKLVNEAPRPRKTLQKSRSKATMSIVPREERKKTIEPHQPPPQPSTTPFTSESLNTSYSNLFSLDSSASSLRSRVLKVSGLLSQVRPLSRYVSARLSSISSSLTF